MNGFYTYMLHCADGTLYTGWTINLEQRLAKHNAGKASKYTRTRLPVTLAASWSYGSKPEAMRQEWAIKQLSRANKLKLIAQQTLAST